MGTKAHWEATRGRRWGLLGHHGLVPGAGELRPERPFLKGGPGDLLEAVGLITCFYQTRRRAQ